MILYRVEGPSGVGPYSEPDRVDGLGPAHSDDFHPTPWEDGDIWDWDSFSRNGMPHCGFASLENLRTWFEGWEVRLANAGHAIKTFDCPEGSYAIGKLQAVFDKSVSKLVGEVAW